jgi:glycosyltransferase involved in cell wall biosynthesis
MAFTGAKRVIAVSKHLGVELQALGVTPDHISVIYNGVDTDDFHPGQESREDLALPIRVPLGLFIGDIKTSRKNLETVLYAVQQTPTLNLVVAGALPGSPYPAMAKRLGVSERVTFVGKVSHIAKLMRSVDLFIFPSRYEAHPLVVVEAMASGLPVIVSGVFGAEHFIGESGVILDDPNDVHGLARVIKMLMDDPLLRQRMGQEGRNLALAMRWHMMAEQYLRVYEAMYDKSQKPAVNT